MDSRSLEYFRAVVQGGSIGAAAKAMYVTQPAVSKRIKQLESQLSLKLFQRTPAGMTLTAAGEALYELSTDALTRFDRIQDTLKMQFLGRPVFRVATPHTTASALIAPFMVDCDPPLADAWIVGASEVDALLDQGADLAVSTVLPPPHRAQAHVADLVIWVYGNAETMSTRFGANEVADLEKLSDDTVLAPRTGVHAIVSDATANFSPPLSIQTTSTGYIAQGLASNSHGFAAVTEQPSFNLVRLPAHADSTPLVCPLYASWDRHHYASAEIHRLVQEFQHWMAVTPPWS